MSRSVIRYHAPTRDSRTRIDHATRCRSVRSTGPSLSTLTPRSIALNCTLVSAVTAHSRVRASRREVQAHRLLCLSVSSSSRGPRRVQDGRRAPHAHAVAACATLWLLYYTALSAAPEPILPLLLCVLAPHGVYFPSPRVEKDGAGGRCSSHRSPHHPCLAARCDMANSMESLM